MNIILFTGGMDSYIGYYLLRHEWEDGDWQPVYFDLQSRYSWKELSYIDEYNAKARGVKQREVVIISDFIDISVQVEQVADYIPQRNALLCVASQSVYSDAIERIALCSVADDVYTDNTEDFHQAMGNLLTITTGHPVQVFTPLREGNVQGDYGHRMLTKNEAVRRYLEVGGREWELTQTISCYHAGEKRCRRCRACQRWQDAIKILDEEDI